MIFSYQFLLNKYNISPKGIIHIGAHNAEESTTYARCGTEKVLWIEANSDLLPVIQDNISIYPQNKVYQSVLSDINNKEIKFNITNASMSSSILELGTHKEQYPGIVIEKELTLFTNRFDALIKSNNLKIEEYNFVNLDIQGAELLALKGFGDCLDKMDYIYTEINIEHVYENCPLLDEIDEFLYSKGFQRVELSLKYESWGDAFYIRKQTTESEKQKSLSESKKMIQKFAKNKKTSNYNVKNSFFYKVVRKFDNKFFKKSKSEIVNQVTRPFNEDFEFKLLNQYKKEYKIILFDIETNHGEYVEKIIKHLNVINLNYEFHLFESKINRFEGLCSKFKSNSSVKVNYVDVLNVKQNDFLDAYIDKNEIKTINFININEQKSVLKFLKSFQKNFHKTENIQFDYSKKSLNSEYALKEVYDLLKDDYFIGKIISNEVDFSPYITVFEDCEFSRFLAEKRDLERVPVDYSVSLQKSNS